MPFPLPVKTRNVTLGGAMTMESAEPLSLAVTVTASRSLVWNESGYWFKDFGATAIASAGGEVMFTLPVTDLQGWRDPVANELVDVSAPGSYSHTYTAYVKVGDCAPVVVGPFIVPTGDGSPVDLDTMLPAVTVAGDQISIPDSWSAQVAAAQESAAAAAASMGEMVDAVTAVDGAVATATTAAQEATAAASAAATSAQGAGGSATTANGAKLAAETYAKSASDDATFTARAKRDAEDAAGNAQTAATQASDSAGDASRDAGLANTSAAAAAESERKAGLSASAAATSESNASTHAGTASTKANEASTSASTASTKAREAADSATLAGQSKATAEQIVQTATFLFVQQGDQPAGALNLADVKTNAFIHRRLTGNITGVTLPTTPTPGQMITLVLTQDATGGRTLTTPAAIFGHEGMDPTLSTLPNSVDMIGLLYDGIRWWSMVPAQRGS